MPTKISIVNFSTTSSVTSKVVLPLISSSLNGTASLYSVPPSTNSTIYANYGLNIISSSVEQANYCIRLPEEPQNGASVSFINQGGAPFYVFPSMDGGAINDIKNGWFQIPNDGTEYAFICSENPAPGNWQAATTATSTTYTSDIISASLGQSGSNYQYLAFVNNNNKISGSNLDASVYNDFLNHPPVLLYTASNAIGAYIYPGQNVWQEITSIVVKTNISGGLNSNIGFKIRGTSRTEYYDKGTTNLVVGGGAFLPYSGSSFDPDFAANYYVMDHFGHNNLSIGGGSALINRNNVTGATVVSVTKNIIPGTFVPSSASAYTSENIGDSGTVEYTLNLNANVQPFLNRCIGSTYLFTFQRYDGNGYDVYYSSRWGLSMENLSFSNSQNYPNLKLQLVYDISI